MFRSRCLSAKLIIDFIAQCVVNENRIGSGERGDVITIFSGRSLFDYCEPENAEGKK
jgi:hypothetical protein